MFSFSLTNSGSDIRPASKLVSPFSLSSKYCSVSRSLCVWVISSDILTIRYLLTTRDERTLWNMISEGQEIVFWWLDPLGSDAGPRTNLWCQKKEKIFRIGFPLIHCSPIHFLSPAISGRYQLHVH